MAIAGGHVGELTRVLHLFHVAPYLPARVVAWSAGAMALTDRVVLFHDSSRTGWRRPRSTAPASVSCPASSRSRTPGAGCR